MIISLSLINKIAVSNLHLCTEVRDTECFQFIQMFRNKNSDQFLLFLIGSILFLQLQDINAQVLPIAQWIQSLFESYEDIPYSVIRKMGLDVEEREYSSQKWICIEEFATPERFDEKSSYMLNILLSYTNSQNALGVNIPMTIPLSTKVDHRNGALYSYEMCLHIPKEFQFHPPKPKHPKLKIISRPKLKLFSLQFGGYATPDLFEVKLIELANMLKNKKLRFQEEDLGSRALHFNNIYSSPSKFWNRKNEVWLLAPQQSKTI